MDPLARMRAIAALSGWLGLIWLTLQTGLLGQDQFFVRGNPEKISFSIMDYPQLALAAQKLRATDFIALTPLSHGRRRV